MTVRSLCRQVIKNFFCLFLLLSAVFAHAQVDLPSGKAQVDFPLFNYDDGGKLSLSVGLFYTDGDGVKVNKMASTVGLGWELNAGGRISRITKGEPDDQVGGTFGNELYATGNLYTPNNGTRGVMPYGMGWVPLVQYSLDYFKYSADVIADRAQDEFVFQFGGRTGRFVINTLGGITILDDSRLKIERVDEDMTANNILTRISSFVITDETGVRYTFSDKELGKIISYQTKGKKQFFLDPAPANMLTYLSRQQYKISNYSVVNGWLLTEIFDPFTQKKIKFSYDSYSVEYLFDIDAMVSVTRRDDGLDDVTALRADSRVAATLKRITQVELPDNTKIKFTYSTADRADLPGAKALVKMAVEDNDKEKFSYQFNYNYFSRTNLRDFTYSFPTDEVGNARLCLSSFQKSGTNNVKDNPYRFTYYSGYQGVPPRCGARSDHWGYYNTNFELWDTDIHTYQNLQGISQAFRRVIGQLSDIQSGTLKSIQYPNGGSMEYEYESNTFFDNTREIRTGGLRVKKVTWKDGIGVNPDVSKEYKYTREDGKSSAWGYVEPNYTNTSLTKLVVPVKGSFTVGALSRDLAVPVLQSAFYNYSHFDNPQFKGQSVMASNLVMSLIMVAIRYLIADAFFPSEIEKDISSQNNSSLQAKKLNPLPGTYARVTVFEGTEADNRGRSVYEFTTDKDFPIQYPLGAYSSQQRYVPGLYGMLKRKKVFNKKGDIVKEVYNKYEAFIKEIRDNLNYSVDFSPTRTLVTPYNYLGQYYNYVGAFKDEYYPLTGRSKLVYSIEKNYTDNSRLMEFRTDYLYDNNYNLKKVTTKTSLNEKIEKRIYYPYDYNVTGTLKLLKDNNVLSVPISTEYWLISEGKEDMLTGMETAEMTQLANGAFKPEKIYRLVTKSPVPKSIIGEFKPDALIRNSSLIKEQVRYVYNNNGELISTIAEDRIESNIYDDKGNTIIAKAMNAAPGEIAFTSFERNAAGNWTIASATGNYIVDLPSPGGNSCLNLAAVSAVRKSQLNSSKKYSLSFWSQGGNVSVTGGTIENDMSDVTRSGWVLRTMIISQATDITISGSGYIDNVRLAPTDAVMIARTYDENKNISSAINENNVISYYEYDELGRIKNIMDGDRNIIKSYNYQYKVTP